MVFLDDEEGIGIWFERKFREWYGSLGRLRVISSGAVIQGRIFGEHLTVHSDTRVFRGSR